MRRKADGRPKRKTIPVAIKREVCERQNGICTCGCGQKVEWKRHRRSTRFDHTPGLFLRLVNDAGTDYVPPQLDPNYVVARCLESDERRRSGGAARATTAGRETNAMAKQRARERPPKPKRHWATRKLSTGRKFPKRPMRIK
jgi:hypothetical protein